MTSRFLSTRVMRGDVTESDLSRIYERANREPMFADEWLVFADALEAAGQRRLARIISWRVYAARRFRQTGPGKSKRRAYTDLRRAHGRWSRLGDRLANVSNYLDRALPAALGLRKTQARA